VTTFTLYVQDTDVTAKVFLYVNERSFKRRMKALGNVGGLCAFLPSDKLIDKRGKEYVQTFLGSFYFCLPLLTTESIAHEALHASLCYLRRFTRTPLTFQEPEQDVKALLQEERLSYLLGNLVTGIVNGTLKVLIQRSGKGVNYECMCVPFIECSNRL
jgi:hypothetical protein